jgi:hypothetical protein
MNLGKEIDSHWGEPGGKVGCKQTNSTSPQVINYYPQEIPARIGNRSPIKIN